MLAFPILLRIEAMGFPTFGLLGIMTSTAAAAACCISIQLEAWAHKKVGSVK